MPLLKKLPQVRKSLPSSGFKKNFYEAALCKVVAFFNFKWVLKYSNFIIYSVSNF